MRLIITQSRVQHHRNARVSEVTCRDLKASDAFFTPHSNHRIPVVEDNGRGAVDLLHDTGYLLKLRDSALKLTVQHDPVGDNDRGVEDGVVIFVVKIDRLVRQPADRVRLARSGRVLDQVAYSRADALSAAR